MDKLKQLLELKSDLNYDLSVLKGQTAKFKEFESKKDIRIKIGEDYYDGITLNIPEQIIYKMICESIRYKESKLSELQDSIATEINQLAKGEHNDRNKSNTRRIINSPHSNRVAKTRFKKFREIIKSKFCY